MEVVRARVLGFCMGVRRAVDMAEAEIASAAGPVYTLGPLIHNPQTLASLEKRGVRVLAPEGAEPGGAFPPGGVVIIRAHGVSPATEENLRRRGARVVDATCPRVKASQLIAKDLAERGYLIFLAGERGHAEIQGIAGYVQSAAPHLPPVIVGNAGEAAAAAGRAKAGAEARAALIAQTTFSGEEYEAVAEAIRAVFPGLEVKRTICGATRDRREALRELCVRTDVDALVIAGGRESANTRRLADIARRYGKPCRLIETAAELAPGSETAAALAGAVSGREPRIGISAGASTPEEIIAAVEEKLRAM